MAGSSETQTIDDYSSIQFEEQFHYSGSDLGAVYTPGSTRFRLWAPVASQVELMLWKPENLRQPEENRTAQPIPMTRDINGTWTHEARGDHNGYFYTYFVTNNGVRNELVDPYAKAVGVNGTAGAIVDFAATDPEGWIPGRRMTAESPVDAVIYELHVRDMSSHPSSGMQHAGKFLAFTETETQTPDGQKTGVAHMKELGITHVHLLPVFDFASLDESSENPGFNWGYDPLNYNVPEGTYATDPFTPDVRIREFKEMVQSLHDSGIGVIMDVVYNHTGPTANSNLNLAVPHYYYRTNDDGSFSDASACGNETASERSMVRKFIVDSVVYWATEYNIDGFRFDLMGIHDAETMNAVRAALDMIDPGIIIYGEGWTAGSSPLPGSEAALKTNVGSLLDARIAAFSDDIRDGIKGSVFNRRDRGFVQGSTSRAEDVRFGVAGSVFHPQVDVNRVSASNAFWAAQPTQTVSYVSAHDNLTLWDKLEASMPNASDDELLAMNRMAATIIFTSQGIPFIHAGEEIARSKGGEDNSYRSPDRVNQIRWDTKHDRRGLFEYYQGLIALRAAYPVFRMRTAAEIQERLVFLDSEPEVLAYALNSPAGSNAPETIIVAVNAGRSERTLTLPREGRWGIYAGDGRAGTQALRYIDGGEAALAGRSSYIMMYEGPAEYSGEMTDEQVSGEPGDAQPGALPWIIGGAALTALSATGAILLIRRRNAS